MICIGNTYTMILINMKLGNGLVPSGIMGTNTDLTHWPLGDRNLILGR